MCVNRCLNWCHCNKTYSIKIGAFHTKILWLWTWAETFTCTQTLINSRWNMAFYSLHSFSAHDLRVSISFNPGIDIGYIESAFIQVECFTITLCILTVMYFTTVINQMNTIASFVTVYTSLCYRNAVINNINKIDSPHNCKLNGKMIKCELQVLGGVY
jgi:hypothetical protein